jgi:hypothetical protein
MFDASGREILPASGASGRRSTTDCIREDFERSPMMWIATGLALSILMLLVLNRR